MGRMVQHLTILNSLRPFHHLRTISSHFGQTLNHLIVSNLSNFLFLFEVNSETGNQQTLARNQEKAGLS